MLETLPVSMKKKRKIKCLQEPIKVESDNKDCRGHREIIGKKNSGEKRPPRKETGEHFQHSVNETITPLELCCSADMEIGGIFV